jgi:hypothetical protein
MWLKFKFDLNLNLFVIYKTDLKKKRNFLFEIGSWAEIQPVCPAWPALPTLRVAQHAGCRGLIWPSGANLLHQPVSKDPTQ